ncbi:GtrA family protein [Candidatus Saccharibacteria bacterium]|nr:GtrA family protein [Candidatus Saccharibacteria bacterium]
MKKVKPFLLFLYKHHFIRYLFVGGSTFIIDFSILYILHEHLYVKIAAATSIAYWVSITYNFLLNRYWTFDIREKESLQKHITTYLLLLIFNYFFVVLFVSGASHYINFIIAKAIAVAIQMTWTYYLYKNHIFVKNHND